MLLVAPPAVPTEAVPLPVASPPTIAPLGVAYYSVSSDVGGKLTAVLDSPAFPARLSLVTADGQALVQSDTPSTGTGDCLIDENVPAGVSYLEVQSLGGGGTYAITANLIPTDPAFQTVPTNYSGYAPLAAGNLYGQSSPVDLVAPDGIHVGNGDGTFQTPPTAGPLGQLGWTVTAIALGDFGPTNLPDIAFTETSPDGTTADLCVLENLGGGNFQPTTPMPVDSEPVAIQTINFGNGIVDLAVADQGTGNVAIFVGNGQGGFSPGPILAGGDSPAGLVAGQFGDGHVDLIVADRGDPITGEGQGLRVFQALGLGSFQPAGTLAAGAGPSAIVAGDFVGNGRLDLAVADSSSNQVSILLNNGNGTFQAPQPYAVGSLPLALAASDFGNGHLDLVVANASSDDVSILMGNGDGTFQPQARFAAGSYPRSLVTADFSGDDRQDLAIGNQASSDISILLGRGDGTFQDQSSNPVGNGPVDAVTADLNHDGHTDIITSDSSSDDVSVLLGNGDGTFQPALFFPAGDGPVGLAVADFNGDGRLDLAVADGGDSNGNGQGVSILMGNGNGTFQVPIFYPTGGVASAIVAGEWAGNGVIDLAVADAGSDSVTVLMGNGRGGFQVLAPVSLGDQAGVPVGIAAGDFRGNGVIDLATVDQSPSGVSILENDGHGHFTAMPPISLGDDPLNFAKAIVAGSFTGSALADLAVVSDCFDGPDNVSILLNQGNGAFDLMPSIPLGAFVVPSSITTGSFFEGGPLDLAIADSASSSVSLLQGDGHGGFTVLPALALGSAVTPAFVATGDFTGNGQTDLAIATQAPNSVLIELNLQNGQFAQPGSVGLASRSTPVVADWSGDGVPDVAIVDGAGDILFRAGQPGQPGAFAPPITVNPGRPSRDIAAVVTNQGPLLASIDANDNEVSLFAYRNGSFSQVGSLATGLEPAQIISADLMGSGLDDLVIRNAGDGTLSVFVDDPHQGFLSPVTLPVGAGISDVSVANVSQHGLLDLLLANQSAGEVEVIQNQGAAGFSPPVLYRAGAGLSAVIGGTDTPQFSLASQDGTIGVVAAPLSTGGPPDLVALNAGADTVGVLDGLGGGRFADPISLPTSGPTVAMAVGYFTANGIPDLAILGPNGLSIWLGNGKGGFTPAGSYDVGPDPTGLTIADVNGDNSPDILVGNAFGDVLVLLGEGNGIFRPPVITDQAVGLVLGYTNGSAGPTFVLVDQSRDRVIVQNGPQAQPTVLADRTSGLLVPGAPVLADLNANGIPDLIVPNSGGNNVLVYPGLPGGGFGPALNDGNGFFTGTNPVSVFVADVNDDGRPDLIVADKGSNDVSILLNEPQGTGFTFVQGPRLHVGAGPVAVLYGDFGHDGAPGILVSDSGSSNLMFLPALGGGFFNDVSPTIVPLGLSPGLIFAGPFEGGTATDIVALNPGTGDVTLVLGLATASPTSEVFSSGGLDPVSAFAVLGSDGFEDLVVANNADGRVALLEGSPDGLTLEAINNSLVGLGPTGLALASVNHDNSRILRLHRRRRGRIAAGLLNEHSVPNIGRLGPDPSAVPRAITAADRDASGHGHRFERARARTWPVPG